MWIGVYFYLLIAIFSGTWESQYYPPLGHLFGLIGYIIVFSNYLFAYGYIKGEKRSTLFSFNLLVVAGLLYLTLMMLNILYVGHVYFTPTPFVEYFLMTIIVMVFLSSRFLLSEGILKDKHLNYQKLELN